MHKIIPEIILASQSLPRKLLLERLQLDFHVMPADIDESALANEAPYVLVERLSRQKALAVDSRIKTQQSNNSSDNHFSEQMLNYIIIASDQIAIVDGKVYGKPGNTANAKKQLREFSGKTIEFVTGLCVIYRDAHDNSSPQIIYDYEPSKVKLKNLTEHQINQYILKDQPFQCAASLKIESLGISLVESIDTADYNAIIGLPLIKLVKILQQINIDILDI